MIYTLLVAFALGVVHTAVFNDHTSAVQGVRLAEVPCAVVLVVTIIMT
jgi:hypothetical protein